MINKLVIIVNKLIKTRERERERKERESSRDVNMKIAFVIKGGKARKAELSPQRRLRISLSAFLKLVSVP